MNDTGATPIVEDSAITSLTAALVDANDRLLGLLALITDEVPATLTVDHLVPAIAARAASIVELDEIAVTGAAEVQWGTPVADPAGSWSTNRSVDGRGDVSIAFVRHAPRFDTGDAKFLSAVATLIANAIATADTHAAAVSRALVGREHATAARITAAALPDAAAPPTVAGLDSFASLVPARTTGGDLYAWRIVGDRVWFAVGDVSGKGLPAAVQMSMVTNAIDAAFASRSAESASAADVIAVVEDVERWVHRRLAESGMFVTLLVGTWSTHDHLLFLANRGHSPVVFRRGRTVERVAASAPPLGVIEGLVTEVVQRVTIADDMLIAATDGFTEQANIDDCLFGESHFDDAIAQGPHNAHGVGTHLLEAVATHQQTCEQSDDRTLLVLHFR